MLWKARHLSGSATQAALRACKAILGCRSCASPAAPGPRRRVQRVAERRVCALPCCSPHFGAQGLAVSQGHSGPPVPTAASKITCTVQAASKVLHFVHLRHHTGKHKCHARGLHSAVSSCVYCNYIKNLIEMRRQQEYCILLALCVMTRAEETELLSAAFACEVSHRQGCRTQNWEAAQTQLHKAKQRSLALILSQ